MYSGNLCAILRNQTLFALIGRSLLRVLADLSHFITVSKSPFHQDISLNSSGLCVSRLRLKRVNQSGSPLLFIFCSKSIPFVVRCARDIQYPRAPSTIFPQSLFNKGSPQVNATHQKPTSCSTLMILKYVSVEILPTLRGLLL